ncbi:glutamate racemase [Microbulbifer yueqingensis]|uniref:Glutamate racemase n=1 Tax=Microbulbifer yueqingensis TaxID=658219 RepID=A0A1G8ZIB4_9GAMM|nr:glutamate racemase [Microbulbifer yueqingensis]SDK14768.1 glutamate racemase [Microbulbifer yueqingensis]
MQLVDAHSNKAGDRPPSALIFDSGVGAISIAREIRALLPGLTLHFGVDNGFFPYGDKTEEQLRPRIVTCASAMMHQSHADILVVGCNTASTLALPELRAALGQPVVGVVPAVKPAARASRTGTIALVATEGTVNRDYTRGLIRDYANGARVINVPAPELVRLAEAKLRGETITRDQLAPVLARIFDTPGGDEVDTVVLACTHFPLLREDLDRYAPRPVEWLDSGAAIARRVAWWLGELGIDLPATASTGALLATAPDGENAIAGAFGEFPLRALEVTGDPAARSSGQKPRHNHK